MMAREDLVNSAVAFLQDPSVATSPIDKRRAFLQSKNLTAEEVELALARAGEDSSIQQTYGAGQAGYQPSPQQRGSPPAGYGYNYPPYPGQWPQQPPQPLQRDWRDWFIMATVTTGVTYGLYTLAKRYVVPLISPPTPPQLEQDKAAIDAEFTRAFALIDQLASDTAAIKAKEDERTERLDAAIKQVNEVVTDIQAANRRRTDEATGLHDEVTGLKDLIPKALEGWKAEGDSRLKDIGTELRSLKMLIGNRVGGAAGTVAASLGQRPGHGATGGVSTPAVAQTNETRTGSDGTAPPPAPTAAPEKDDQATAATNASDDGAAVTEVLKSPTPSPFNFEDRLAQRTIPAWQMAAAASAAGNTGVGSRGAGASASDATAWA